MKPSFFRQVLKHSVMICLAVVVGHSATPAVQYPNLSVTPSGPRADKDSVSLVLTLGSAANSCMAPTFTGMISVIEQSPLAIYPQVFNVALSYTMVPVPPTKMCPDIYAPADYGPAFRLGKLALGTYNVTDQNTKKQVGSFSVTAGVLTLSDTVTVTPQKPTTKDSLHFDLFNANWSCCTQYYQKTVSIADTMIMLSFQYSDLNLCECFAAGSHTLFACGPQKAGKYSIYQAPSLYCAAPPCPLGVIRMTRVGEVIVYAPSAIAPVSSSIPAAGFSCTAIGREIRWKCVLSRPGRLSVSLHNAAGTLVSQQNRGNNGTGPNGFSWTAPAPGAYFISVNFNGAPVLTRKVVVSR